MIHPGIDPAREAIVLKVDGMPDRVPKVCSKCRRAKPTDEFGPKAGASDGLRSCCRSCDRIAQFVRYHDQGGRERKAAYEARPDVLERRRQTRLAREDRIRAQKKAYRATVRGRLVDDRAVTRYRLRKAATDDRRARCAARLARLDAEIARLDRERELPLEPPPAGGACDYRGVIRLRRGGFEVRVSVPGGGQVYGGRFGAIDAARARANALAFEATGERDYARPKRLRRTS